MNKKIRVLCFITLMALAYSANAQVYKKTEDTAKLNKEFTEVSNDIANLTAKLTVAQNNKPGVEAKAVTAEATAQDAAQASSAQADKATNGSVKEARKAKREAKKAYREAKHSKSATDDIGDQDKMIASLTGQLAKKQERLGQLTEMRNSIIALLPQ